MTLPVDGPKVERDYLYDSFVGISQAIREGLVGAIDATSTKLDSVTWLVEADQGDYELGDTVVHGTESTPLSRIAIDEFMESHPHRIVEGNIRPEDVVGIIEGIRQAVQLRGQQHA